MVPLCQLQSKTKAFSPVEVGQEAPWGLGTNLLYGGVVPKVANGPGGTNWGSRVGIRKPCFTFRGGCRRVLDTKTAGPTQGHKKRITRHHTCAGIKENACGQLLAVSESRGSGPGPHTSLLAHPFGIVANPNFNERCRRGTIQGQKPYPPSGNPFNAININFYA